VKRLLLCMIICTCFGVFAAAQTAEGESDTPAASAAAIADATADATDRADSSDTPKKGFAKFWSNFTDVLFTPQIHKPFSVAGGLDLTQNDRVNVLPELYVMGDYELSRFFGFGLRAGLTFGSSQPSDRLVSVMEGVIFGRFYVWDFGWIRPFVHTGLGVSVNREQEYEVYDALGELGFGARAHWTGWFLEGSFRVGYPFRLSFGLAFGHSFLP
jgi:hypothetical protein